MAKVQIGRNYLILRDQLREEIRRGELRGLERIAEDHACFCCARRIEGRMYKVEREIVQETVQETERYFLHPKCYEDARVLEYREGMVVQ
ncbi:MAG: hypothetical protein A2912_02045 [Candidatus Buchananbacteria bacterium RIFCSPLOWO2_01_FULL_40_23b]|uniref:Uncharacterized protein n=1 Tax=Candidatus Buchananbacteria bacterium RIFCSPLOWO2_01_FULL_40_23b TaxID=1797544 RepID=A0A1G1YLZ3_9BACT|nr:MAG: hypothetical protein A2912_02045 [Candidatus Buchananbacteria bacterium RIFCSPLOWO2_01_FULL_40_23b]